MTSFRRLALITAALALSACGEYKSNSASSSSNSCVGSECAMVASRFKANNGLLKQSQAVSALQDCLKLPDAALSAETKQTFASVKLSLSAEGVMSDMNGPMMMALSQLAGDMCNDRIKHEAAGTPDFFKAFEIKTGTAADSSANALEDSIVRLAKGCWGRDPMKFEIEKIKILFEKSSFATKRDKGSALFVCTLVLSATDVLIY
jgi:hypothetical protein